MEDGAYLFDLHMCCGGFAYFSTFTIYERRAEHGREVRRPSEVSLPAMARRFDRIGRSFLLLRTESAIEHWLLRRGWAAVPTALAHEHLAGWLRDRVCVTEALSTYTDVELVAPQALARRPTRASREAVRDRDGHRCLLCGRQENLTIQHIRPHSRGGSSAKDNVCVLCRDCNERLGADFLPELYELAGQPHALDLGLIGFEPAPDAWEAAVQLSGNLMRTRALLP